MKLRELSRNSSHAGVLSGLCAVLGAALVVSATVRLGDRLWAHLETRLWSVPGAAPLAVLAAGALLCGMFLRTLRHRGRDAAAEGDR